MTASARIALFALLALPALAADEPSFSRDVRPILSDMCFQCHGPDDKGRKGGLRLDDRDAALAGGKSGAPAIALGTSAESEILKRMLSTDPDEVMPPPATKKHVSAVQIDTLRRWIDAGAKYEKHWAFVAPVKPAVPPVPAAAGVLANEIDAFVGRELAKEGLDFQPPAAPAAVLRRLSFDLIGLPPTPDEVAAFEKEASQDFPGAVTRTIDRLLASPHYGERWARKWLDLARYADTNGYEKDRQRTMWPYRDWVIRALNADMPFDRFTIEQLAGDLLPNPTTDQLVATGFHRNTMLNEEGGIDPLEYRFHAMTDRVSTTGATWLGLTMQCVQCHTHKYDPIPHQEYYGMMAFLNNADEPELELPDEARTKQDAERAKKAEALIATLADRWPEPGDVAWTTPRPVVDAPADEAGRVLEDSSVLFPSPGPERTVATLRWMNAGKSVTRLRLEALTDDSAPGRGPGRTAHGNFVVTEVEATAGGKRVSLRAVGASTEQPGFPVAQAVDGNDATGWAVDAPGATLREAKWADFEFAEPVSGPLTVRVQQNYGGRHTIARLRVSLGAPKVAGSRSEARAKAFHTWLATEREKTAPWQPKAPAEATSNLPLLTVQPDASVFVTGDITKDDTYTLRFRDLPPGVTAVRLEVLPDERLPARGPGMTYYEGPKGDFFLGEFAVLVGGQPVKIASATASHAKNHFGGSAGAELTIDGNPETGWSAAGRQGRADEAVFRLEKPLAATEATVTLRFGRHFACSLGKFRLSFTTQPGDWRASRVAADVQPLLAKTAPTAAESAAVRREFLLQAPELASARQEIEALLTPAPALTALVMRERPPQNPRPTFLHKRGEFTQPAERVEPMVIGVLNPLPPGAPKNRLTFAKWLVSRENPLTARVVVNRTWAAFFGRGLVKTQEDFGLQGDLPSHPELLDWLAVRFMDEGWSFKKLHRLIVSSRAYLQAANFSAAGMEKDAENKLLWRGPRLRLEAEEVRDAALRASGLLSAKMFGPSVFPPQSASVTTEGTYGALAWPTSTGEDRHRRSVYTFAKRTAPFAFANTFDAPTGEACIVRRDRSNTPLQALSLLNDITIAEAAAAMGDALARTPGSAEERIASAFVHCFSRRPTAAEVRDVAAFFTSQRAKAPAAPEAATWTLVARALMNTDEFVTK